MREHTFEIWAHWNSDLERFWQPFCCFQLFCQKKFNTFSSVLECHSKSKLFNIWSSFNYTKSKHVGYSSPHCIVISNNWDISWILDKINTWYQYRDPGPHDPRGVTSSETLSWWEHRHHRSPPQGPVAKCRDQIRTEHLGRPEKK